MMISNMIKCKYIFYQKNMWNLIGNQDFSILQVNSGQNDRCNNRAEIKSIGTY